MQNLRDEIMNMNQVEIDNIIDAINMRRKQLRDNKKLHFKIGDLVSINDGSHKNEVFIVKKINPKTILIKSHLNCSQIASYRCSPSLLEQYSVLD